MSEENSEQKKTSLPHLLTREDQEMFDNDTYERKMIYEEDEQE